MARSSARNTGCSSQQRQGGGSTGAKRVALERDGKIELDNGSTDRSRADSRTRRRRDRANKNVRGGRTRASRSRQDGRERECHSE